MSRSETAQHARLKVLALEWARANGFAHAACEVRVPRSGFRADVVAWSDAPDAPVAVFECKQSRADFLKDAHAEALVRRRLAELSERLRRLEEMLAVHCPQLRRGEALWAEYDTWDFETLEHRGYRRLRQELATLRRRVREGTKFSRMTRYACADRLYLVSEPNIFAEAELPADWGLLVRRDAQLESAREPQPLAVGAEQRRALADCLARAQHRLPSVPFAAEPPFLQFELSA